MTQKKHTKAPWETRKSERRARPEVVRYVVDNAQARELAECEREEDAAFIVEAANNHDRLKADNARLQEERDVLLRAAKALDEPLPSEDRLWRHLAPRLANIRKAIALCGREG